MKTCRKWSFYYSVSVRIKRYLAPGGNCLLPAYIQGVLRFVWIKTTGMLCDGLYLPRYLNRSDSFCLSHVFSQPCVLHITFWFSAYSIIKLFHSLLYSVQRFFWKGRRFFWITSSTTINKHLLNECLTIKNGSHASQSAESRSPSHLENILGFAKSCFHQT